MVLAAADRDSQVLEILRTFWGFESLRPVQKEVIDASLDNRDAVVVMPTGGGKSLCFQLPALVEERLTVVVSPLIALMKDQIDALTVVGVPAAALNSSLDAGEEAEVRRRLVAGELRLLYISPERFLMSSTLELIARADRGKGAARFAIDEAHCISAWGHDFRPEYRQLSRIKEVFPGTPVQAFTATATPRVQRDIAIQLKLERPRRFVGIFDRPNLTYRVVAKDDAVKRTIEAVRRYPDEGIIVYCLSRKDTEMIANALVANGIPAVAYHAGLPNEKRREVSEAFAQERANVVVATVAFGMGIDRSNVRCVIHECLPKSMEGYQQETGRAGRDGLPSECVLLYSHGDVVRLKRLLADGEPEIVERNLRLIDEVRRFATSHRCRHLLLSEHFGQAYEVPADGCGACDVCLGGMRPLKDADIIARQILETTLDLQRRVRSFGVGFLVAVLTGSRSKPVLERRGDTATGFGKFAGDSSERITSWVHQLTDLGLLAISEGQYPLVSVGDEGQTALAGEDEIVLVENEVLLRPAAKSRSSSSGSEIADVDRPLFEKLRAWRRTIASERGVPAYVILHDATLMRIAAVRPSKVDSLRLISGIGERRIEELGEALLALVTAHCEGAGLATDQTEKPLAPGAPRPPVSAKTAASYDPHFRVGLSVNEAAAKLGLKPSTVWQHLAEWVERARPASIDPWVDPATQDRVRAALIAVEGDRLKPIFEHLGGSVPYEQIRVVRAFAGVTEPT